MFIGNNPKLAASNNGQGSLTHEGGQRTYPKIYMRRVIDMYWKMDGEMSFKEFIYLAITEMRVGRRFGYVRLFLYPTSKDLILNGRKRFAIFIRKRDIYVVGVEVNGTRYEIGERVEYGGFFNAYKLTGFGKEYGQLFQGTGGYGDLVGAWIGFHVLNQAILRVIHKTDPLDWAWSIGVFALTFSECVRFIWFLHTVSNLINDRTDIRMQGQYKYMAKLPKVWREISDGARDYARDCAKRHPRHLKPFAIYSINSLHIQLWDDNYIPPESEAQGGGVGPGYGDGGGTYVVNQ